MINILSYYAWGIPIGICKWRVRFSWQSGFQPFDLIFTTWCPLCVCFFLAQGLRSQHPDGGFMDCGLAST